MTLIDKVCNCKSVAVVGMEKNTGKTECLNYVLEGCRRRGHRVGVTSIGIDGESCDQVTRTAKPEITLAEGTLFATSEKFFQARRLTADIIDVSSWQTALGRLVTAQAVTPGKVILSGPVSTAMLRDVIGRLQALGSETVLVDGALSRKSLASPIVTDAMILSTGAALSSNLPELVRKTRFVYDLLQLPIYTRRTSISLSDVEQGIFAIADDGTVSDLGIASALLLQQEKDKLFKHGHRIFASGVVGDKLFDLLRMQPEVTETELVVKDFTKIFASPQSVRAYLQKGGRLSVVLQPELLAICVNPWSPTGYVLNSEKLREAIAEFAEVPVVDVRERGVCGRD
ncbi:MAG: hypothetical protein MJZ49_06000 [Bacteroidales bacterium]|nr:hypothetical protein [Bacteroidales bacterium]